MDQRTPLTVRRDEVLDRIVDICLSAGSIAAQTDKYFTNTSRIVQAHGDSEVTFAVFMRRRVVAALEPTIRLINRLVPGTRVKRFFNEGDLVPSEMKMMEITGSMAKLSEIETLLLQKTGFPCVSANNAYEMCRAIPTAGFLDMHARHASGAEPGGRHGPAHLRSEEHTSELQSLRHLVLHLILVKKKQAAPH